MCEIRVRTGPARTGKTSSLLVEYRQALKARLPGTTLWLAPNSRSVQEVRNQLLDATLPACLAPGILTFSQFAETILASTSQPSRLITTGMKRQLIREILKQHAAADRLHYFRAAAGSPGILNTFCGLISDFKRLEIWPEDLQATFHTSGQRSVKDREVLAVYEDYQNLLLQHRLYDAEGRFWLAHEELRRGETHALTNLEYVVVDGFTDFTRTQHDILEILSQQAQQLTITLPLEETPGREDLFAKSQNTLAKLQAQFPHLRSETTERKPSSTPPGFLHLEQTLFSDPRTEHTAPNTIGLEILAASGQLGEIELLAGRIKELLVLGDQDSQTPVKPEDIVVIFRSVHEVAPLVAEVFAQYGIPFLLETSRTIAEVPGVSAFLNLLRLIQEDWPYRRLIAVLGNNYFSPNWPEWNHGYQRAVVERTVRQFQVPRGSTILLSTLERAATAAFEETPSDSAQEIDDDEAFLRRWHLRAQSTLAVLQRLKTSIDQLPHSATPSQWSKSLHQLALELGFQSEKPANTFAEKGHQAQDRVAWEKLLAALCDIDRLRNWMNLPPAHISRGDLLSHLVDIADSVVMPSPFDETGRVRVLHAPSARGVRPRIVFLAGLSEKSFPRAERDGGLYTEAEYQRLNIHGLWFPLRTERTQEEMLLFYELVTAAREKIFFSFPGIDEKAQPLLPSPFLTEVERVCGSRPIPKTVVPDLSPIPICSQPRSPYEWRVLALSSALQGETSSFNALLQTVSSVESQLSQNLLAGIEVVAARGPGRELGIYEGILTSAQVREQMQQRFGPQALWSASQLEQYAYCPYQFFAAKLLKLEPLPDMALQVDYLTRGRILHNALASLHRQINLDQSAPSSPGAMSAVKASQMYDTILHDLVSRPQSSPLDTALRVIDHRLLKRWGPNYLEQHAAYDESWNSYDQPLRPTYFEASFGTQRNLQSADPISTPDIFVLEHAGQQLQLTGRVDRIDVGQVEGQTVFNILDYKTGSSKRLSVDAASAGLTLQLPLYAIAVQELLLKELGAVPWQIGYWFVRGSGYREKEGLSLYESNPDGLSPNQLWQELKTTVLDRVFSMVHSMRQAEFPVLSADEHCTSRCDFRTICRIAQVRALDKTWSPDHAVQPSDAQDSTAQAPAPIAAQTAAQSAASESSKNHSHSATTPTEGA